MKTKDEFIEDYMLRSMENGVKDQEAARREADRMAVRAERLGHIKESDVDTGYSLAQSISGSDYYSKGYDPGRLGKMSRELLSDQAASERRDEMRQDQREADDRLLSQVVREDEDLVSGFMTPGPEPLDYDPSVPYDWHKAKGPDAGRWRVDTMEVSDSADPRAWLVDEKGDRSEVTIGDLVPGLPGYIIEDIGKKRTESGVLSPTVTASPLGGGPPIQIGEGRPTDDNVFSDSSEWLGLKGAPVPNGERLIELLMADMMMPMEGMKPPMRALDDTAPDDFPQEAWDHMTTAGRQKTLNWREVYGAAENEGWDDATRGAALAGMESASDAAGGGPVKLVHAWPEGDPDIFYYNQDNGDGTTASWTVSEGVATRSPDLDDGNSD